ncbi:unnamed protein product [Prorocentrum cordatum]|uniref:Uncharacterized protein n=1 Tax=Prorocentrum cordatum TaxID=2364126 RepID=A0ABN9X017_9DINO|nr:unnamed protein product [Polarella glacialis]
MACPAEDHPGDAAAKALRPLSPRSPRAAPRLRPRRAAPGAAGLGPPAPPVPRLRWQLPASPEGCADSPGPAASTALASPPCPKSRQRVSFSDRLETEVPLLDPHWARVHRPRRLRAASPSSWAAEELQSRANMAKVVLNYEKLFGNVTGCFNFVWLLLTDRE